MHSCSSSRAPTPIIIASTESNDYKSRSVGTPLEPQSHEGMFLCGILKRQPHLLPLAAREQLKELAAERDSAVARWEHSQGSSESYLHGRIAEMKEHECQIAVEEIMYFLIVHRFSEIKVPMVPSLSKCITNGRLDIWSSKDIELESIHTSEVLDMVREHLSNVLRWKGKSDIVLNGPSAKIKRLQFGRIYAASIMYGYFLKSVSLRHHLELSLAYADDPVLDRMMNARLPNLQKEQQEENLVTLGCSLDAASLFPSHPSVRRKSEKLRRYMMGFDSKTLQLCAKLRSREAANLIEKHSWALFGDQKRDALPHDEVITVSLSGLKRLMLEAVAFGSFLWDVEDCVDCLYKLKET